MAVPARERHENGLRQPYRIYPGIFRGKLRNENCETNGRVSSCPAGLGWLRPCRAATARDPRFLPNEQPWPCRPERGLKMAVPAIQDISRYFQRNSATMSTLRSGPPSVAAPHLQPASPRIRDRAYAPWGGPGSGILNNSKWCILRHSVPLKASAQQAHRPLCA